MEALITVLLLVIISLLAIIFYLVIQLARLDERERVKSEVYDKFRTFIVQTTSKITRK